MLLDPVPYLTAPFPPLGGEEVEQLVVSILTMLAPYNLVALQLPSRGQFIQLLLLSIYPLLVQVKNSQETAARKFAVESLGAFSSRMIVGRDVWA